MKRKTLFACLSVLAFLVALTFSGASASVTHDHDVGWHSKKFTPSQCAFVNTEHTAENVSAYVPTDFDFGICSLGNLQSRNIRQSKTIPDEYWCGGDSKASRYIASTVLYSQNHYNFSHKFGKDIRRLSCKATH